MKKFKALIVLVILTVALQASQAFKITQSSQLLSGNKAKGIIGDYLIDNNTASFVISNISHKINPGKSGGLCLDATLKGGLDDFDLLYLYLNNDYPRQAVYTSLEIVSAGAPHDSAHIRVSGVDSDNASIKIITDYILYDNTPTLKVKTEFKNTSSSAIKSYGIGDAFSWGSTPFVPGKKAIVNWLASTTPNTVYGYWAKKSFDAIHGSYWSDTTIEEEDLKAGETTSMTRYFTLAENLAGVYNNYLDAKALPSGDVNVTVLQQGEAFDNALIWFIKEFDPKPTLEVTTDNLGSASSRLETGNWVCTVTGGGQTENKSFSILDNSSTNIAFDLDAPLTPQLGYDTLTIIQSPLINIPAMALPGDTIEIKIELVTTESVESVALVFNNRENDINFIETNESSPFGLRILNAYLPEKMLYGLYDLKLYCTGPDSLDVSESSIYVIPEYKKEFTIIHVTDTHLPSHLYWGDEGLETDFTELEDFEAVIDDINIINPDFVLHTGDFINDGEIEALGIPSISLAKTLLHKLDVPLYLVAGNHDLGGWKATPAPDGTARRTWWNFFGWKYLSSLSPTDVTTQDYSFNYGKTHFIGLEAYDNYDEWRKELYGNTSFISSQLTWLNDNLAKHSDDSLIVLFYHYDFKNELNLTDLGVDIALWGHVHGNNEDNAHPYSISTEATCDGRRGYRIIRIRNNEMVFNQAVRAGENGNNISQVYNADSTLIRINNTFDFDLENCLVKFPLEHNKTLDYLSNAELFQIDTLSDQKMVYALVNVPANSMAEVSIVTKEKEVAIDTIFPETPFLMKAYPNPFNPKLAISYQLSANSNLTINILDINGRLVDTLYTGYQTAGNFELNWDASMQPSGIYFINATIQNDSGIEQFVEKCLLMK
ncbi:MAG: metallophosphoesterase [Candidatus Neomarinimicrobiota bacterium]